MFQQLLGNKHHRLRDSMSGQAEVWVWSPTKLNKRSFRAYNRALTMTMTFFSRIEIIRQVYYVVKSKHDARLILRRKLNGATTQ